MAKIAVSTALDVLCDCLITPNFAILTLKINLIIDNTCISFSHYSNNDHSYELARKAAANYYKVQGYDGTFHPCNSRHSCKTTCMWQLCD